MIQKDNVSEVDVIGFLKEKISSFKSKNKINHKLLLSIVIPVYNEEKSIANVINRIPNHFLNEIIVVDDGSTDNSIAEVFKIKKDKNIKIIKHKKNLGYGAAIITGIKHAKGDIIITLDSDGQHNPEEIYTLISPIINKQADVVIGSRYKGKSTYKVPLHTRSGEFFIKKCLWYIYRQHVGNNQSGFRAFSKKALSLFEDVVFSKFGLCTEIIFKAANENKHILEVPITIKERKHGQSSIKIMEIITSICSCIVLYFLKRIKIGKLIPKLIWHSIYSNIIIYLKKIF